MDPGPQLSSPKPSHIPLKRRDSRDQDSRQVQDELLQVEDSSGTNLEHSAHFACCQVVIPGSNLQRSFCTKEPV